MSLVCFESGSVSVLLRLCPFPSFTEVLQSQSVFAERVGVRVASCHTAHRHSQTMQRDRHTHAHTHTRRVRTHTHMTRHPSAFAALTLSCRAITLYIIKRRGCTDCEIHQSLGELVKILTLINCELQSHKTVAINHNF